VSACGNSQKGDAGVDERAFVDATSRYLQKTLPKLHATARADERAFARCPVVKADAHLPSEAELSIVTQVLFFKAISSDYARYSRELAEVRTHDPALRRAAEMVARLVKRYMSLERARPDVCRVLRQWKAAGWREPFDVRLAIGVPEELLDKDGVDRSLVARNARRALLRAEGRLRELGASSRQARLFVVASDVFPAGSPGS
jgi:hypothetical protein